MSDITRERLEEVAKVCNKYRELRQQREAAYLTYTSPRFDGIYKRSAGTLSDPTAEVVNRIDMIDRKISECLDVMIEFEEDLLQIRDYELQAIIRSRYILGDTWTETTRRVMNCYGSDAAKKRLYRYLNQKHE